MAQPPRVCGLGSRLWLQVAHPAFHLLQPQRGAGLLGALERGGKGKGVSSRNLGAGPRLWGQVELNKAQGRLRRSGRVWMPGVGQGRVGRGGERRTCWNFFFPGEAISGLE